MINEAISPLIANGDGWSQHKRRLIDAPHYFETQYSFPRSRCRNDVEPLVIEIRVETPQKPRLICAPCLLENDRLWKCRMAYFDGGRTHEGGIISALSRVWPLDNPSET